MINPKIDKLTLPTMLKYGAEHYLNNPALSFVGEKPITYAELLTAVKTTSLELLRRNIGKGDKVAIIGENSPNWIIAYYATVSAGAVVVPILTGFPETMVRHIIRHADVSAVFVQGKHLSKVDNFEDSFLRWIISLDDLSFKVNDAQGGLIYSKKSKKKNAESKKNNELLNSNEIKFYDPEENDLAVILYTSGTTGHSKGVMLTQKNVALDVYSSLESFTVTEKDRVLSILPLAHAFETAGTLAFLFRGAHVVYLKGLPTPQNLLQSMQQSKPTGCLSVPLVMDKIYRRKILTEIKAHKLTWSLYQFAPTRKLIHRKAGKKIVEAFGGEFVWFVFGGAAINQDLEIFMKEAKIPYTTGYGMTEASPIVTINPFETVRYGSCGRPISCMEMKINNPNPATGIGEVYVRGGNVMLGYYNNPQATSEAFTSDGWLKTGDLGYLDSENFLFLKGRSKNVIIGPSGENIYPEMIEQVVLERPQIQEAIVYQESDMLAALVFPDYDFIDKVIRESPENDLPMEQKIHNVLEELRKSVNQSLPNFSQISKIIERTEPFEMTPTNKIKRYLYTPRGK